MKTRRRRRAPKEKPSFKSRLLNQSIFCVIMIVSVMCVNSVNKTQTNVFIENIKHSLYTSIDYKKTADSIKNTFEWILRKNNDDEKTNPPKTDSAGEPSGDTSFDTSFICNSDCA